jgi:hypothetical protein
MLLRRSTIVVVLLVLLAGIAAASVSAASAGSGPNLNNLKSGNGGYSVSFSGKSTGMDTSLTAKPMTTLYGSISQNQVQWTQVTIGGYTTSFSDDLYWGNPSNSLSLTVYTPDGYILGPYYSSTGNIGITISKSNGVADGTYYFEIYGYHVIGSQSYTFT